MADPARSMIGDPDVDDTDTYGASGDPETESYDEERHGGRRHFYTYATSGRYRPRSRVFTEAQLRQLTQRGRELLERALRERPAATIAGAFAFGFVLGNGLPTPIARAATGLGMRILVQHLFGDATEA